MHLQHHFETPQQQFESGKLGMWLFLATEILLFGGLFCAYGVYRGMHPEIFAWAHVFLNTTLGATNTVILLSSSLTMAWAVRAAQLGQRRLLIVMLGLTLLGGAGFMAIKYVEYRSKFEHGLLWASRFEPHLDGESGAADPAGRPAVAAGETEAGGAAPAEPAPETAEPGPEGRAFAAERSLVAPAAAGPAGRVIPQPPVEHRGSADAPANARVFFSIYFLMTGLHGLHVIIGMLAIGWILVRAAVGQFGPDYFTPVDFVGLYWHLVDLIWIFLFPLLYLIH